MKVQKSTRELGCISYRRGAGAVVLLMSRACCLSSATDAPPPQQVHQLHSPLRHPHSQLPQTKQKPTSDGTPNSDSPLLRVPYDFLHVTASAPTHELSSLDYTAIIHLAILPSRLRYLATASPTAPIRTGTARRPSSQLYHPCPEFTSQAQ